MKKAVCLVSGGYDSPLACYIASKSYIVIPLHFVHYPYYCKGSFEIFMKIASKLKEKTNFKKLILFPYAEILGTIVKSDGKYKKYMCILCRKAMLKAAEKICSKEKADVIVTGEILSSKASQTLSNIRSTHYRIKYKILHPLLCWDKNKIIKNCKEHGLIEDEQHVGCCTAVPYKPATRSAPEEVEKMYKELNLDEIIDKNLKNILVLQSFEEPINNYLKKFI